MNKKYFDTKTGSLEDAIVKVATEQPSITKQEPNVRLETKTYFETKPGSISDVAAKIVSEALDPVNKDAVKKDFKDRQDKDIDNDGDTDSTDKYLHKRRAAISKNLKEIEGTSGGGIYALRAIRDKRERLQDQLRDLDKNDPNYKQKADALKNQIQKQREIMHRKQREVFGSYDPSIKEARWEIEGRVNYKGVGPEDGFHMVIDAPNQDAAENKAFDELVKARKQRKIGPGGGGGIDEMEIEYIEKTNDRLQPVSQVPLGNSYDPSLKEDDMGKFHKMQKDGKSADEIAKALGLDVKSVKKLMDLDEVVNPYAVGMAQAMKQKNDKPPLEKSTITKAHDIAKSIMKKEEVCPKCGKDHGSKINASNCMGESKKSFSELRTETKEIQLGDKGKTLTGKKAGVIDVEPRAKPI